MKDKLQKLIDKSTKIVFFGGAGVSTDSGIPDFRSSDGLYADGKTPEYMLSIDYFRDDTHGFFDFYRNNLLFLDAKPNKTHNRLSALELEGKQVTVITQNIDGLHQKAGSSNVLEIHGSIYRNFCTKCKQKHTISCIVDNDGIPRCDCGGTIKPDVVLYGESLDQTILGKAIDAIEEADLLIIGGTSLSVYPAASLVNFFKGENLVIINKTPTAADCKAKYTFNCYLSEVLG